MKIVVIDTEDNTKGKVRLLDIFDGEKHHSFEKDFLDNFRPFIKSRPKACVIAHNLDYDLNNLYKGAYGDLERHYTGGHLIWATDRKAGIRFLDSSNHWRTSLESVAEALGMKKYPVNSFTDCSITELKKHCQRDTEILWALIDKLRDFYQSFGLSKFPYTAPSASLKIFAKRFCPIEINTKRGSGDEFIREAMYGGRCEIFHKRPPGIVNCYDVNALYPYIMITNNFPLPESGEPKSTIMDGHPYVVEASVEAPDDIYFPVLPVRYNGYLIFPKGKFTGVWASPEFELAIAKGYKVIKIYKAVNFLETTPVFQSYMQALFDYRKKSSGIEKDFYKLMQNSLYGKFAEKSEGLCVKGESYCTLEELKSGANIDGLVYLQKTHQVRYSALIWSVMITALARVHLYQLLDKYVPYYCDTDSIFTAASIETSSTPGTLKLVGSGRAEFIEPKVYQFNGQYKAKGVPREAQESYYKTGRAKFRKPLKFREAQRRLDKTLEPNLWIEVEKVRRSKFEKRKFLANGDSIPLTICDAD